MNKRRWIAYNLPARATERGITSLSANTLSILADRLYRYYGVNIGMRKDILRDCRKYGSCSSAGIRIYPPSSVVAQNA